MQKDNYAAVAAFSIIWVVLAYISKFTSGAVAGISFYLPILLIFTVPLLFGRNRALLIGALGGVIGVNYLISGGFQGALVSLVYTIGVMMGGMYYLAPKSMAKMRRPVDWFTNIVLTVALLAVGETLAAATGAAPNLGAAWSAVSGIVVGGAILAIVNCILLKTLVPAFETAGLYPEEELVPEATIPPNLSNQAST